MLQDRVSNPGPLTYQSGALPVALLGPAADAKAMIKNRHNKFQHRVLNTKNGKNEKSQQQTLNKTSNYQNVRDFPADGREAVSS